ncbi:MAG: CBS domain-containing protein [Phormidesmis sp.]
MDFRSAVLSGLIDSGDNSQGATHLTARSLMSAPVQTISPEVSISAAQTALRRYGHSGLCVVDASGCLVGIISRRDIDTAQRHGLGDFPVKGWMNEQIVSIAPESAIAHIHHLMTTYDVGRLPVLEAGSLVGMVTRSDLLRQISFSQQSSTPNRKTAPYTRLNKAFDKAPFLPPPSAATLHQTLKTRLFEIWPALMLMATVAQENGWSLYLVGGAVRDLLLEFVPNFEGGPQALTDIDLVVDGANSRAGVALAQTLQAQYPQVSVQIHDQFQTAALAWPATQLAPAMQFDIATARTEFYPYPAANPEVEASAIQQDLYRRDFTINAMAMRLNPGLDSLPVGHLLDFFSGWIDLQRHQVRVLHSNSFIEDPTRIFRAVRFAVRLKFSIEAQTERFIQTAISSGIYSRMRASPNKTPALQSRLKAELKYLLQADSWEPSLQEIDRLGALACLDSNLQVTPTLCRQLRRLDRWLIKLAASQTDKNTVENRCPDVRNPNVKNPNVKKPNVKTSDVKKIGRRLSVSQPRWLILLELLLLQLPSEAAVSVAANLNLGTASLHRLENLHRWEALLLEQLPLAERPSQIYALLSSYQTGDLLLISDRHPRTLGAQIWQYIVHLSRVIPPIDGATLKRLGLQPGPQFRTILTQVHQLALDGELATQQAAENYVLTHYALSQVSSISSDTLGG